MTGLHQRFNKTLFSTMTVAILVIATGCSSPQTDPSKTTIPTDSDQWQKS
ncbi:hypothetical protein ACOBWA_11240 [Psychrobacter sp. ER1]